MTADYIIFTLVALVLAGLAVAALLTPLWRGVDSDANTDTDITIYRDQLREVDRDVDRGVLDPIDAERTRIEISRRLLAADADARQGSHAAPRRASRIVAGLVGVAVLLAAGGLYWSLGTFGYGDLPRVERLALGEERRANRPSQLEAEAEMSRPDGIEQADEETRDILQALRAAAFERPDDVQAWAYLSQVEAGVGNYQRAARAQEKTIALLGDNADTPDRVRLLDFLVAGTQGYVSAQAEAIAATILRDDPQNPAARYYAGLMYAQNDRPDQAFGLWRPVVEEGDPDTFHWNLAASQIESVAAQLGMDYVLPERRGPSAADIEAAQNMAPEDRDAMVEGMVAKLADRLATEGGPPQDWARLISALMVIGDEDAARTVLAESETVFGGDVQAVQIIRRAASEAGLEQ